MRFDPHCSGVKLFPERSDLEFFPRRFADVPVSVFLDRWYPRFGKFNSVIPVDVIKVKSYVDSFLDPTSVPV